MLHFDGLQSHVLARCVDRFREAFDRDLVAVLARELRGFRPAEAREILDELDVMQRQLVTRPSLHSPQPSEAWPSTAVHEIHARLLKRIVLSQRLALAREIDEPRQRTTHREAIGWLERELRVLDALMQLEWMVDARPARLPRLTDYLTIRHAEALAQLGPPPPATQFDDKFGILAAGSALLPELAHVRARCELRERSVALCYLDIDDFKAYNTRFGETRIDRDLLAPFMAALEAAAFMRGNAYRIGGDEYVVVLPNADTETAGRFVHGFAAALRELRCPGIDPLPTVSAGVVELRPDCALTEREALSRADRAKAFAKSAGKACSASYGHPLMRESDLALLAAR